MPTASSKSTPPTEALTGSRLPRLFPAELFLFTDKTRAGLLAHLADLLAYLDRPLTAPLHDLAFTVSHSYQPGLECVAVVAASHADLREKLGQARDALGDDRCHEIDRDGVYYFRQRLGGKLAFLFPGENAQYVNMLAELCLSFPEIRGAFDEADAACSAAGDGFLPSALNFPVPGSRAVGAADEIAQWEKAVVLVHTANSAMSRLLGSLHLRPDAVLGHSFGELSALEMAGVLQPGEGKHRIRFARHAYLHLRDLSQERDLPTGRLLAVGGVEHGAIDALLARFPESLRVAMENCPHQYVLCAAGPGMDEVIAEAARALAEEGAICSPLPIRRPYHTPFFEPAFPLEKAYYEEVGVHPPRIEVYSCATAEVFPAEPSAIVETAARHWMSTVRFQRTIETMYERGFRTFVDVGPRGNLCAFVADILKGKRHRAVALNRPQRSDLVQLLKGLGVLAAQGVPLRVHHLHERWGSRVVDLRGTGTTGAGRKAMSVQLAIHLPIMKAEGIAPGRAGAEAPARPSPPAAAPPTVIMPPAAAAPPRPATPAPTVAASAVVAAPAPVAPVPHRNGAPHDAPAVMISYMETMERFLAVQGDVLGSLLTHGGRAPAVRTAAAAPAVAAAPTGRFPLLGTIEETVPGESLVARRTFDVRDDLYLTDHALGTTLSTADPTLRALPVMALVFSSEMASEAAAALFPDLKVIAVVDTRAHRPIFVERGSVTLRVRARRTGGDGGQVHVRATIEQEAAGRGPSPIVFETSVVLADRYPAPPPSTAADLTALIPAEGNGSPPGSGEGWPSLYPRWTFHGPLFQGVSTITRVSGEGVDGALRVPPRSGLIRSRPDAVLEIDPVLLDSQGQAIWLWGSPRPFAGTSYLPYSVGALRLYGPPMPPGTPLLMKMRVRRAEPLSVVLSSEAIDAEGRVRSALEEVALREFQVTPALSRLMMEPTRHYFADVESFDLALPGRPSRRITLGAVRDFPIEILESSFGVWRKTLAFLILSPPEREEWMSLKVSLPREIQWLLGRAAAKDALRGHFQQRSGRWFAPAELMLATDPSGRPVLRGGWHAELPGRPEVSISHTDGLVVAAAAGEDDGARVGVDAERIRTPSQDLLDAAFSEADLLRLPAEARGSDAARSEWVFRLWCAKEAVGKALGSGVSLDPRQFAVTAADPTTGLVAVRPPGGSDTVAATLRRDQHVLAFAVLAAAP
jgi:malonyl CoA-acyl carrier protein transacylase/phosphopantetheinyl transferase